MSVKKTLQSPSWKVSCFYGVVQVPDTEIRIILGHVVGLLTIEVLDALIGLVVELQIQELCRLRIFSLLYML